MAKKKAKSSKKSRSSRSGPKYGEAAVKKIEKVMHERKRGTLRSGGSGKKVTSRKQAIAIGLSEARRAGDDVPEAPGSKKKKTKKKTAAKKKTSKKKAGKAGSKKKTKASGAKKKKAGKKKSRAA